MYNITDLEQKWQIYNSNRKKRVVAILSVLILTLTTATYFIANANFDTKIDTTPKEQILTETNSSQILKTKLELTIPTIDFEHNSSAMEQKDTKPDVGLKNKDTLESAKKAYLENKNFKTTIELAKAYYLVNDYDKARFYAVEANSLEPTKEDGWIVFANSCVKLGLKNDAVIALSKFNQAGGTQKTKELEKELKSQ